MMGNLTTNSVSSAFAPLPQTDTKSVEKNNSEKVGELFPDLKPKSDKIGSLEYFQQLLSLDKVNNVKYDELGRVTAFSGYRETRLKNPSPFDHGFDIPNFNAPWVRINYNPDGSFTVTQIILGGYKTISSTSSFDKDGNHIENNDKNTNALDLLF